MSLRLATLLPIPALVLLGIALPAFPQSTAERNLQTCLSGRYPALCDHRALTSEQSKEVRAAEERENLRVCLAGKYPALCDHSRLTPDQAASVKEAERLENLTVCSSGRYPALCNHKLLSSDEDARVQAAEKSENLKVCADGRYPALCNHSLLTPEQAKPVGAAEKQAASRRTTEPAGTLGPHATRPGNCQSGLSIESVEGDGKVIKLDDGSMWEVNDVDTVDTSIWLAADEVVLCEGKIINTDENESAEVTPIRPEVSGRGRTGESASGYAIDASANDETFVIDGEVFTAQTYCFHFDKGDHVKFIEGSPFGACSSAKLLNLRTGKVCEVWCGD